MEDHADLSLQAGVRTISKLLRVCAEKYEDKPAIRWLAEGADESRSYRRLYRDSLAFCRYLQARSGDRLHIAVMGKTTYRYLTALNAVMMSGNTAVPLDPGMTRDDAVRLLRDADTDVLFYDSREMPNAAAVIEELPSLRFAFDLRDETAFAHTCKAFRDDTDDGETRELPEGIAAIIYTSGTTGERKGAMLSSAAIVSNIYFREMNFEGDHVALNVLPMHHIFSFSCDYLKNLKDGVTVCLNSDLSVVGQELAYFAPTVIRLVPMIVDSLLRRVRILRRRDPTLTPRAAAEQVFGKRLTNIIVSGAAYSADNDEEFREMGISIRQGYGMTETGPRIAVPDGRTCAASGGRIISICQVRLQKGEIQVKSPSLMSGYYKRDDETRAVFTQDGWFRTGDLGRITPDNELFITGRLKNVIILSNGENVSPEEIERKLRRDPLIREAEIFEENGGIAADIYPDEEYAARSDCRNVGAAVQETVAAYNAAEASFHVIDKVYIRSEPLEKTATGKIKRRKFYQ